MVVIDGTPLTIEQLVAVARHRHPVSVDVGVAARMATSRRYVEELDARGDVAYGVTTGFGALADRAIDVADRITLQRAVVRSHAAGMGPAVDAEVVRGMMLLRARTLCAGYSGVRTELVDAIVAMLNSQVVPFVPEHGSLGASGDLAPLAHAAACLCAEGEAVAENGGIEPAAAALARGGLRPLEIGVKEGLALINGTDAMTAVLALALHDLALLMVAADCVCAMSVEALLATTMAFDDELVRLRPAPGQQLVAANLRALLRGSPIVASHRESHHAVQDAYSLRCAPQVHGAGRDVLGFAVTTVDRELSSIVDNPVILGGRMLASGGNFHGQALAYAADMCASVCADVAAISERRVDRLLDPARSRGLPAFLSPHPGVNSGLMITQYTAAECVARLRAAAAPMAVQSAATSAGQEDHVSMGWAAALRTRCSVDLLRRVLAVEAIAAAQALELRRPLQPGPATAALVASLRERSASLAEDRILSPDLRAAEDWLAGGEFRHSAEPVSGPLA
ncbi:MAG TPA: histidine ammonia-lyase [Candidatus Dormibacteraeota bacterium]|nr:histidine ammonia-lyase [Candidatus Dormibacteraeota bacterium]